MCYVAVNWPVCCHWRSGGCWFKSSCSRKIWECSSVGITSL